MTEMSLAERRAAYTKYYEFLDALSRTADAPHPVDALIKEFGLGVGEAHGVWTHYWVTRSDGGTAKERAMWFGGM